jgi:glutamyl-tRNA reductase
MLSMSHCTVLDKMNIILVGLNHKTATVEMREQLTLSCAEGNGQPLSQIMRIPGIKEALLLSTCNRFEILANGAAGAHGEPFIKGIKSLMGSIGRFSGGDFDRCLYAYHNEAAVRHLFRVASSIDSMVMGEPQILGQVKDAYRTSVEQNAAGPVLNKLLHHAFRVAKKVRTETAIAENAVSVSFAAVELAKKIFGDLKGKVILLLGAGEMAELAAGHLINQGIGKIIVANRTHERAIRFAEEFHGVPAAFDQLGEILKEVDIVIGSTGSPSYLITKDMIAQALRRRKNRLIFLIDIAVPRDIDPAVNEIDNVYLYNIDDLQGVVDENIKNRLIEAQKAEEIIGTEVIRFSDWFSTLKIVPTIVSLRKKMEDIASGELEKSLSWIKELDPAQQENIRILTGSILNKVLHDPVNSLKEESNGSGATAYVEAVRKLFKLEENSDK